MPSKNSKTAPDAEEQTANNDTEDAKSPDLPDPTPMLEIPYRGHTFVAPENRDDWSTEGLSYLSEGKYDLFVKYTLEIALPGQWRILCALCPRRKDFSEFFVEFSRVIQEGARG